MPDVTIQFDAGGGVTEFEVLPYALPFSEPYATARGVLERREMVLLRVHTAEGLVGLGEAVPLSLRGGATLDQVDRELRDLAGAYAEAHDRPQERSALLLRAMVELSPPARCALQTAWLDLGGKAQGVPVWKLLGANSAEPVECNATLTAGEPLHVAQRALEWADEGFSTFKLKVGVPKDDDQVAAVRRAVGPQAKIRVDANGAWGQAEAGSKLNAMAAEGIELAEQPCGALHEMVEVGRRTEIPIVADESVVTREDALRASAVCDMATLKLSKVGGPLETISIAGSIPSYLSSALDGAVGIAAAAHTVQVLPPPGVAHGLATQRLFGATIASVECELRDGFLHLPEGPGLGVEIDERALEYHRL